MSIYQTLVKADIYNHTSPRSKWQIIPRGRRAQEKALGIPKGTLSGLAPLTPVPFGHIQWGLKWTELREIIANAIVSKTQDAIALSWIRDEISAIVPVRSGRLLDTIYKTMHITRAKAYNTYFYLEFTFTWSPLRPLFISNPQHSPPSRGYGERYKPQFQINNVKMIKQTKKGALYILNDPASLSDPKAQILDVANQILLEQMEQMFNAIELRCRI